MLTKVIRISLVLIVCTAFPLATIAEEPSYRILHVMSYHQSWKWNSEQLKGFKDGVGDLNVEYKIIELDTKRQSDPEEIAQKVNDAENIITEWQPNLLYTNDDNAQKYVAEPYVNSSLPIVFSGVNRDPSEYGFIGAKNVTGVMEYEHFLPTLNYLRKITPDIQKLAVIVDSDPTWKGVMSRMRANLKHTDGVEVTDWLLVRTLDDYKSSIKELQDKVDAIALLGVFNIKDSAGNDVNYEELLQWTAENSNLPDFSFWESRVDRGTLCVVAVSGYEQGLIAGQMARKILKDKVSPGSIGISQSTKGQPMLNITRAKALGIKVDVNLLLESTVKQGYAWNK
jgi:ABC-type uncharacterized transport system substrate-binding protein